MCAQRMTICLSIRHPFLYPQAIISVHVLGAAAPVKAALVVFGAIIAFHPQLCLLSLPSFAAPKLRADTPLKWTCRLEYYILKPYIYMCAPAKQYDLECLFHSLGE